ncbi:hypothetical protein D3C80_1861330 [compost metagenome]
MPRLERLAWVAAARIDFAQQDARINGDQQDDHQPMEGDGETAVGGLRLEHVTAISLAARG